MSEPESAVLTPPDTTSRDRDLLRTLIDTLPDSIYVKDADGRYILDNMAHMRHVGAASTGEIVG